MSRTRDLKILMLDGLVGSEYAELLSAGLHAAGVDVRLVVPENRPIYAARDFPVLKWSPSKDPKVKRIRKVTQYLKYLANIFKYVNDEKIDVIHYQFFRRKSELLFFLLLRALGKKVILTAHNVLPHEYHWSNFYYQRTLFHSASGIIAHSDFIKNKIFKQLHISPQRIVVIPHGSYEQFGQYNSISQVAARKKLGLQKKDQVLLFFGYIKPYKGLDLLLDAFDLAKDEMPDLKLIIAGGVESSELKKYYQDKIDRMNVGSKILPAMEYIPAPDVAGYFMAADIVALPYRHIYHSGVVHTAFAFGRPIIATDVGDFREVAENGACGFISEKNTAESFATEVIRAFSDQGKLKKMGNFCRELSQTKYNWDSIAQKTKEFYLTVINYNETGNSK